jgi:methionyl-tRNA synthetase
MKKFYVTTAIDYVNSKPHLGHAYEKITTDVIARWHRLLGEEVFFLTGTDENAQKVARAAKENGRDVKEFVNEMAKKFILLCKKLNISNDDFIRTTEQRHREIARLIFQKMFNNGDIYKGEYEGMYCYGCEAFYLEKDLKDGKCPIHGKPPEVIKEETYFFRLSKYEKRMLEFLKKNKDFILPSQRRNEIINRVKEGLKDISVSRYNVEWGIRIPFDKKHRIYVWKEALENYITALGYPDGKRFRKFWPCDYHFIGSDINWFHSVIWPCILMSLKIPLPRHVFVHGFINIGGEKMSKSKGLVVDPIELADQYGADPLRYFLIREIPFGQDGEFSIDSLINRVNSELIDNYCNLFYRVTSFIDKNFGEVPKPGKPGKLEKYLEKKTKECISKTKKLMEDLNLGEALKTILSLSGETNKYFQHKRPWEKIKSEREDVATTLYYSVNVLRIISNLLFPFIPETSERALKNLGTGLDSFKGLEKFKIKPGDKIRKGILLKKIEMKIPKEIDPFSSLDLKVAKIENIADHPNADKLYILKINLGFERREIIAAIKDSYERDELLGKNIIVLSNLKPSKIRGIESKGMLLAVGEGKKIGLLTSEAKPGSDVLVEGMEKNPAKTLNIKDFMKLGLIAKGGKVYYGDKTLKSGKYEVQVEKGIEGRVV